MLKYSFLPVLKMLADQEDHSSKCSLCIYTCMCVCVCLSDCLSFRNEDEESSRLFSCFRVTAVLLILLNSIMIGKFFITLYKYLRNTT